MFTNEELDLIEMAVSNWDGYVKDGQTQMTDAQYTRIEMIKGRIKREKEWRANSL